MSRTPFDAFSKQFLQAMLEPFGQVNLNREVAGESRWVDVWFEPALPPDPAVVFEACGLLGHMALTPSLFEPFRAQPPIIQVLHCKGKLFAVIGEWHRQAEREGRTVPDSLAGFPRLWILVPSASAALLHLLKMDPDPAWPSGMYFGSESDRTALVAINQLPQTPDTLWLRLLGKGHTQNAAVSEVLALPPEDAHRSIALQLLSTWKISMEVNELVEQEEQELMVQLSQAYLEWEQRTRQSGIEQGMEQGIERERSLILRQLTRRVGQLSPGLRSQIDPLSLEQWEALGEALLDFRAIADLEAWLARNC